MTNAALRLTTVTFIMQAALAACGGGQVIEQPVKKAVEKKPEPVKPDAYRDFGGQTVTLGTRFKLKTRPIGIVELKIVIELVRTVWTTRELPDGKEVKDGTAELLIRKGEISRRVRLDEGESRVIYGAKITVEGAGEAYDKDRLDYMPWVDLLVTRG